MSARSNQDIQRAYEEIALKDMLSILNRRTIASAGVHNSKPSKAFSRHITPPGKYNNYLYFIYISISFA